jgi:hypothetical protein
MPTFVKEDYDGNEIEIDIEVDEFLEECSSYDLEELTDYMEEINRDRCSDNYTIADKDWADVVNNLRVNRLKISVEDEELIRNISKKY